MCKLEKTRLQTLAQIYSFKAGCQAFLFFLFFPIFQPKFLFFPIFSYFSALIPISPIFFQILKLRLSLGMGM